MVAILDTAHLHLPTSLPLVILAKEISVAKIVGSETRADINSASPTGSGATGVGIGPSLHPCDWSGHDAGDAIVGEQVELRHAGTRRRKRRAWRDGGRSQAVQLIEIVVKVVERQVQTALVLRFCRRDCD